MIYHNTCRNEGLCKCLNKIKFNYLNIYTFTHNYYICSEAIKKKNGSFANFVKEPKKSTLRAMIQPSGQKDLAEILFLQAAEYDRQGDIYNAVKLYKRIIKMAPDWSAPFSYLSLIYKCRNEWRPSLHYSQKAIENNPFDEAACTTSPHYICPPDGRILASSRIRPSGGHI